MLHPQLTYIIISCVHIYRKSPVPFVLTLTDDSSNVASSSETTGRLFSSACKTSQRTEGMDEHRAGNFSYPAYPEKLLLQLVQ